MNSDEQLDRAAAALRETETGDPPPRIQAETMAALRRAERRGDGGFIGRLRGTGVASRLAAALLIAACGLAVYLTVSFGHPGHNPDRPPQAINPTPPAPSVTSTYEQTPAPGETSEPKVVENTTPRPPVPPREAVAVAPVSPWSITGTVAFAGDLPAPVPIDTSAAKECGAHLSAAPVDESLVVRRGRLANVVVSVRPVDGRELPVSPAPAAPARLDQHGCRYQPHVLAMRVGQPIVVSNSDPLLHNVRALTLDNPAFNFGQPTIDPGRNLGPMKAAEVFKVKCDFHPWMLAYVHVFDHPYFAVTANDGTFAIPAGLPDGKYTLVAWQEKLGEREVAVELKGGKAAGADFVFKAE
jgi:hypothetical protein